MGRSTLQTPPSTCTEASVCVYMHVSIPYKAVNYDTERVFIEKNKEFYKRYFLKSVENMNKIIKEKYNSEFTVILWNDFRYKFDKDVAQFLKKANIDVIELEEFGKEYVISDDGHPNYAANKKIADILIRHLKYGN